MCCWIQSLLLVLILLLSGCEGYYMKHLYSIGGLAVECDFQYNVMQCRSKQVIATGSNKITDLYISCMSSEIILLNKENI